MINKSKTVNDSFFEKVYKIARLIPYGRATSYGAIAKHLGSARSARMVGWAMNGSHVHDVPAHRVVNRVGVLTGKHHFGGTEMMADLLRSENVEIEDNKIVYFEKIFWDPSIEL